MSMSSTVTVLVGNGLGMALDPAYFNLEAGMKAAWEQMIKENDPDTNAFRRAIGIFLKKNSPENESDLQKFHEILMNLIEIDSLAKKIPPKIMKVVHPEAHNYKTSYRDYVVGIASHFFNYPLDDYKSKNISPLSSNLEEGRQNSETQFEKFIKVFTRFIRGRFNLGGKVHVATLNYDALLYKEFINERIISGGGLLFDGMLPNGFDSLFLNLDKTGRYLHLHGSPLFYNDANNVIKKDTKKVGRGAFDNFKIDDKFRPHIFLCHSAQKEMYINRSNLLSTYFQFFERSLRSSDCLIIIGYSGNDPHINKVIGDRQKNPKALTVKVVEYKDPNYKEGERQGFWEERLGSEVNYQALPSILDYDFSI